MKHNELLAKIDDIEHKTNHTPLPLGVQTALLTQNKDLRAVVELHKPRTDEAVCIHCSKTGFWITYPCPTIQAIEKELEL